MSAALHQFGEIKSQTGASYVEETPIKLRTRLMNVIALYFPGEMVDSIDKADAIEALAAGRATFWTTSRYHSQRAQNLFARINSGMSIADALKRGYGFLPVHEQVAGLDTLIPINFKAAVALSEAYEALGTFRDVAELEMRRVRGFRKQGAA